MSTAIAVREISEGSVSAADPQGTWNRAGAVPVGFSSETNAVPSAAMSGGAVADSAFMLGKSVEVGEAGDVRISGGVQRNPEGRIARDPVPPR